MDKIAELKNYITVAEMDMLTFERKGTKASATRARKALLNIRKISDNLRKDILVQSKKPKEKKEKVKEPEKPQEEKKKREKKKSKKRSKHDPKPESESDYSSESE